MLTKATGRQLLPLSFLSSYSTPDTWEKPTFHQQRLITSGFRDATLAQHITYTGAQLTLTLCAKQQTQANTPQKQIGT